MRITDIATYAVQVSAARTWLFIAIHTDSGHTGWGEASQSRNDEAVIRDIETLKAHYVGKSPLDLIEPAQAVLRWPYIGKSLHAAVSGLDQALWDLAGKHFGVPVYQLLGGAMRHRVRAYANIGYALDDDTPGEYARVARAAVESGFDAVKFYPFGEKPDGGHAAAATREWLASGVERVQAVRSAVGPDIDILVDVMHQIDDYKLATRLAELLAPVDPFWIEDPFSHELPDVLAAYRSRIGTRLAGGAPCLDVREYRQLLEAQAFDVLMPDVKWLGGLLAVKKAAALADVYGVMCSPHSASGPVSSAASVQVSATISNFLILEYAWGVPPWRGEVCTHTEKIDGGHFVLSARPGLGVDLDEAVLRRYAKASTPGGGDLLERGDAHTAKR